MSPPPRPSGEQMLRAVGLENVMDLYRDVPEQMLLREPLHIPDGMSELEAARAVSAMAAEEPRLRHHSAGRGGL